MTAILAASNFLLGGYTLGFVVWALMNGAAFYVAFTRVGFRDVQPVRGAIAEAVPAH
jgi:NNP family nitrate/nitrite transporter-like MFS transporter